MSISAPVLQFQLHINAQVIKGLSDELATLKFHRRTYYEEGQPEQARVYTPFIRKFEIKLRKITELQKELKYRLKEAYYVDRCSKYHLPLVNMEEVH